MDKGSRAYGIQALNDGNLCVYNLILLNDDMVVTKKFDQFNTAYDNQTQINMHFYESECEDEVMDIDPSCEIPELHDNQVISWGRPVPKHTPVSISVERDKSGLVRVFVECSGAKGEFVLDPTRRGMIKR